MGVADPEIDTHSIEVGPSATEIRDDIVTQALAGRLMRQSHLLQIDCNQLINKPTVIVAEGNYFSRNVSPPALKPTLLVNPITHQKIEVEDKRGELRPDTYLSFSKIREGSRDHIWELTLTTPTGRRNIHRLWVEHGNVTGRYWGLDHQGKERETGTLDIGQLAQITSIIDYVLNSPQAHAFSKSLSEKQQQAEEDVGKFRAKFAGNNSQFTEKLLKKKIEAAEKAGFPPTQMYRPQPTPEELELFGPPLDPRDEEILRVTCAGAARLAMQKASEAPEYTQGTLFPDQDFWFENQAEVTELNFSEAAHAKFVAAAVRLQVAKMLEKSIKNPSASTKVITGLVQGAFQKEMMELLRDRVDAVLPNGQYKLGRHLYRRDHNGQYIVHQGVYGKVGYGTIESFSGGRARADGSIGLAEEQGLEALAKDMRSKLPKNDRVKIWTKAAKGYIRELNAIRKLKKPAL